MSHEQRDALLQDASHGENSRITINLKDQEIVRPDGEKIAFDVDPFRKHCLLEGLDDIGITLQSESKIKAFEERNKMLVPWMQGAKV